MPVVNYSDPVLKMLWTMALSNKFLSTSQQVKFLHQESTQGQDNTGNGNTFRTELYLQEMQCEG